MRINEDGKKSNARISIVAENGHFLIPTGALPRFDSQNGEIYFYADGEFKLDAPSAKIKIKASHGLFSASESDWISLKDNSPIEINLTRMWKKQGWYSGDHHFHLNYGGPFKLQPADLVPVLQGEDLDFATPMVANLHFQLKDQEYLSWERKDFLAFSLVRKFGLIFMGISVCLETIPCSGHGSGVQFCTKQELMTTAPIMKHYSSGERLEK